MSLLSDKYATMMKQLLAILLPACAINNLNAQYFSKISIGDLVNTFSDSRSCNWIDFNSDGLLDNQITNGKYPGENNMLYTNNHDGTLNCKFYQILQKILLILNIL